MAQGIKWVPRWEEREQIILLYTKERLALSEIAARYRGASRDAVAKYLRRAGVISRTGGTLIGTTLKYPASASTIIELYTVEQLSINKISQRLNICRSSITNYLERAGIVIRRYKHGMTETVEYMTWCGMKTRCYNSKEPAWSWYGGREVPIVICQGWRESFESFFKDMGTRPIGFEREYSIDRINNDGNYSCGHCEECIEKNWPANCHWATAKEQIKNRRPRKVA